MVLTPSHVVVVVVVVDVDVAVGGRIVVEMGSNPDLVLVLGLRKGELGTHAAAAVVGADVAAAGTAAVAGTAAAVAGIVVVVFVVVVVVLDRGCEPSKEYHEGSDHHRNTTTATTTALALVLALVPWFAGPSNHSTTESWSC